ncbi:uncharacterized protein LOC124154922 [Ischnura elegans]|uniref:uncharacterized protein LOC124154922 n=1 Tax=Ischnura elegans TaxID=197161 RepID=UPI001ED8B4DA|nr:uncharacterized protein LOC124154922 [Ischnura elegans]
MPKEGRKSRRQQRNVGRDSPTTHSRWLAHHSRTGRRAGDERRERGRPHGGGREWWGRRGGGCRGGWGPPSFSSGGPSPARQKGGTSFGCPTDRWQEWTPGGRGFSLSRPTPFADQATPTPISLFSGAEGAWLVWGADGQSETGMKRSDGNEGCR